MKISFDEYTVTSRKPFPLDMLRYDQCWPHFPDSVTVIALSLGGDHALRRGEPDWVVHLCGVKPPTSERWESFGWTVQK